MNSYEEARKELNKRLKDNPFKPTKKEIIDNIKNYTAGGTFLGGLTGAGIGAGMGSFVKKPSIKKALIGAGIGSLAGGGISHKIGLIPKENQHIKNTENDILKDKFGDKAVLSELPVPFSVAYAHNIANNKKALEIVENEFNKIAMEVNNYVKCYSDYFK